MTDVDVRFAGVFMLLSYSELRGLLVLVRPLHPRRDSLHTHDHIMLVSGTSLTITA